MDREEVVQLRVPGFSNCLVNLRGCSVVSWNVGNEEMLYMNRCNVYNGKAFMIGGIALTFPQFGQWIDGPDYGFNSLQSWKVTKCPHVIAGGNVCAEFTTSDDPWTKSMWDQTYTMLYTVILSKRKLYCRLCVKNNNKHRLLNYKIKFMNYIRVPDVTVSTVNGLMGCKYVENDKHENEFLRTDNDKSVSFSNHVQRLYIDVPHAFSISPGIKDGRILLNTSGLPDLEILRTPHEWMLNTQEDDDDETLFKTICLGTGSIWKNVSIESGCMKVCEQTLEHYTQH